MEQPKPEDEKSKTWWRLLSILVPLSIGPWFMVAFLSMFMFDAPGSENNVALWCIAVPIWCYPLLAGVCILVGFPLKRKGHLRQAIIALAIPLVAATVFLTGLAAFLMVW